MTVRAVHSGGEDPELSAAFMKTSMAACLLLRSKSLSPRLPLLLSAVLLMAGCGGGGGTSAPPGGSSGGPQIKAKAVSGAFGNVNVGSNGSQTTVINKTDSRSPTTSPAHPSARPCSHDKGLAL